MSNITGNRSLQAIAAGDAFAMAKKNYEATVLAAFEQDSVFWARTWKKPITSGNSVEFPAIWRSAEASHTVGVELAGTAKPQHKPRTITLEALERVAHDYEADIDKLIAHFDSMSHHAKEHSLALIRKADSWIAQVIALGARTAATGDFAAGSVKTVGVGGDLTLHPSDGAAIAGTTILTAFPRSLKGSKTLQAAIQLLGEEMTAKFVPLESRVIYLSQYLINVLRQDTTLTSGDWARGAAASKNDLLKGSIGMVEGFEVVHTTNMPSTDLSADATVPTAYQGDFSRTVCVATGDQTAVGTVVMGGGVRPEGPTYIADKLAWLICARLLKGHGVTRPEACGEIRTIV